MGNIRYEDLNDAFRAAIENYANQPAFTGLKDSKTYTFGEVGQWIVAIHRLLRRIGIDVEDKIALCAPNSSEWAVAFIATLGYGAVSVPILNDFTPADIQRLVAHSQAKILFTSEHNFCKLDMDQLPEIKVVIDTDDNFRILYTDKSLEIKIPRFIQPDESEEADLTASLPSFSGTKLALINYTSGSTGNPKGVMLSRRAILSNLQFAIDHMPFLRSGDGILSMLPLAHMYGMLVEMIFPFCVGAHTYFLGRTPSPQILLQSFAKVRPKLIITVPLVIEKIIFTRIFPILHKGAVGFLNKIPGINLIIRKKIRQKLIEAFGGNLHEMIIGGAALNPQVEKLLTKIKFPFTIGYGMTECAPLIAYAPWTDRTMGSCGRIVDRMEARIDSPDPGKIPGELMVRGANVMDGYYRNPEASRQVIGDDGWMRTGDIVTLDKKGFVHIKGRSKTMLLGPSGQNIYPEEIEALLNRMPYVIESLIVSRDSRLIALIVPDRESAEKNGISPEGLSDTMKANIAELNRQLPSYSKIASFELMELPFEKTPKHSIKRYLYS